MVEAALFWPTRKYRHAVARTAGGRTEKEGEMDWNVEIDDYDAECERLLAETKKEFPEHFLQEDRMSYIRSDWLEQDLEQLKFAVARLEMHKAENYGNAATLGNVVDLLSLLGNKIKSDYEYWKAYRKT